MLPYLVRKHNKTSQTRKIRKIRTEETKKPTGVLKNVMQDQKGCENNNIRAKEQQITAARAKQHEDEEEDTGIRPKKTKTKNKKTADRSSEECYARSERLQEQHTC